MKFEKTQAALDRLTPEQRRVTQKSGTERPFTGEYNDNKEPGIYVDVVSESRCSLGGQVRFKTGWPSFTKPIVSENVNELRDTEHGMVRTEVRSTHGDSHLGHVFPDGPSDRGGLRYCINSASFAFHPSRRDGRGVWRISRPSGGRVMNHEKAVLAGCSGECRISSASSPASSRLVWVHRRRCSNATYRNHGTHAEGIEVIFDPELTSYRNILEFFFRIHDPTTKNRQAMTVGSPTGLPFTTWVGKNTSPRRPSPM